MPSSAVSKPFTTNSDKVVGNATTTVTELPGHPGKVVSLPDPAVRPATPQGFVAIDDLVAEHERDPSRAAAIAEARRELAEETAAIEGRSIRTRRLELGYSQVRLAELIGSSQSHVARIERGTENVQISTCRRLSVALEVDMNTLDTMLEAQERVAHGRGA